jgi:hypothetical protein
MAPLNRSCTSCRQLLLRSAMHAISPAPHYCTPWELQGALHSVHRTYQKPCPPFPLIQYKEDNVHRKADHPTRSIKLRFHPIVPLDVFLWYTSCNYWWTNRGSNEVLSYTSILNRNVYCESFREIRPIIGLHIHCRPVRTDTTLQIWT